MINPTNIEMENIMKEMSKLALLMMEQDIPFEVKKHWSGSMQIFCPSTTAPLFDVVCFKGSFGYELGLLEVMWYFENDAFEEVEGYLTANEILEKFHNFLEGE